MKKIVPIIIILTILAMSLCACLPKTPVEQDTNYVRIVNEGPITLELGEQVVLTAEKSDGAKGFFNWSSTDNTIVTFYQVSKNCTVTALAVGQTTISVNVGNYIDTITITVVDNIVIDEEAHITLSCEDDEILLNKTTTLSFTVTPDRYAPKVAYRIVNGEDCITLSGNTVKGIKEGEAEIVAYVDEYQSNPVFITVIDNGDVDPYIGVSRVDFYSDYTPATDAQDAHYRSIHGFVSGDITPQDQAPTVAENMPMDGGKYVRNTTSKFSDDGNTYYVYDASGNIVNEIYRDGGYVSLEEVAAYVLAFSDVPKNYTEGKSASPNNNVWGKYLRLNHSKFSGSTSKYPYEPVLPRISGCGGDLLYYEIDIGTTGTDCDPGYAAREYNNGNSIVRGAARIVYSRFFEYEGYEIVQMDERHVFYTYNHYNDFQEYLNYQNGWGEMFGNITGGGSLSSKYDYNPTDYVPTASRDFGDEQQQNSYTLPQCIMFRFKKFQIEDSVA